VDAVSDDGSSSSHTLQAQDASSSSYELVPAPKKQKGPFGQALSRKKKNFIALDSSSGSSSSSSSTSSSSSSSLGSSYLDSSYASETNFKLSAKPFYKSIRKAYKLLDLKLWAADVNYSTRKSIFKSLNEKMKVLLKKTDQCHHGDKI
jgi:hypothetical protein